MCLRKIFAADTKKNMRKKESQSVYAAKILPQPHFADSQIGYLDSVISVFSVFF